MRLAVAGGTGMVGRHVVEHARRAGHDVVVLSRSEGVDVRSGAGLADALRGVDTIIDVTNAGTTEQGAATEFFTEEADMLQRVGATQGVGHIVTLSIVGIDRAPAGYFAAKLEHERAAAQGTVPVTIMRATQFHEFAAQFIGWALQDATAQIPHRRVQTVAARTAAAVLVEIAQGAPAGWALDLAGPDQADLVDLARAFVRARELDTEVLADDSADATPAGALLPADDARIQGPTFQEWLAGEDAATLTI